NLSFGAHSRFLEACKLHDLPPNICDGEDLEQGYDKLAHGDRLDDSNNPLTKLKGDLPIGIGRLRMAQCASSQLSAARASTCSGTESNTAGNGASCITCWTTGKVAAT